jgi:hypothetical protein
MNYEILKELLTENSIQIVSYFRTQKDNIKTFELKLKYKNLKLELTESQSINTHKLFKRIIKNLDVKEKPHILT